MYHMYMVVYNAPSYMYHMYMVVYNAPTCTICILWLCTMLLHVPYVYYGCVQCSYMYHMYIMVVYNAPTYGCVQCSYMYHMYIMVVYNAPFLLMYILLRHFMITLVLELGQYIDFAIYRFCNISSIYIIMFPISISILWLTQYYIVLNRYRIHMAIIECIYLSHALFQFWSIIVTCMWKCTVVWAVCYWIPIQPTTQYIDISNSQ